MKKNHDLTNGQILSWDIFFIVSTKKCLFCRDLILTLSNLFYFTFFFEKKGFFWNIAWYNCFKFTLGGLHKPRRREGKEFEFFSGVSVRLVNNKELLDLVGLVSKGSMEVNRTFSYKFTDLLDLIALRYTDFGRPNV